ncbi:MAG: peptidoglycan-binding protein [bacterium]|nr:peptidoglycan-binding protein [bacterium]
MPSFEGYLFAKLANIGTRSEGPAYFLQGWDETEMRLEKKTRLWEPDPTLHHFLAKKVIIVGRSGSYGIQYDSIAAWQPPGAASGGDTIVDTSSRPTGHGTLTQGAMGEPVRYLQERLRTLGYVIAVDGYFGSPTRAIVEDFQAAHGLEVTGVVDASTWAALG